MNRTAKNLAVFAYRKFLTEKTFGDEGDETCWIVVDDEETGMDVTYHLVRQYVRDATGTSGAELEIPYDTLPTQPAFNPKNGRAVFVLSQPNHIPTVQVSMQGTVADLREGKLDQTEKNFAEQMGVSGLEEKYMIDAQDQEPAAKTPDLILLDQRYPMWNELDGFVSAGADVQMTDRVEQTEIPDDLAPSGQYEPAE